MNKIFKRLIIGLAILAVVLFAAYKILINQTKKASPEDRVELVDGDKRIEVLYCQPSKNGRKIFGDLVPYGEVWRTGANEASTFETSHDLLVGRQTLPAGKYTLWTIPNKERWTVIFNDKMYGWGVDFSAVAAREPQHDVLKIDVPVKSNSGVTEQFTINLKQTPEMGMTLAWDQTLVRIPLAWK